MIRDSRRIIMKGALEDVKVLDLSRVLAGPFCTMMLADMGAEVIKLEVPGKGDDSRGFPPIVNGESGYFMNMNRNKKGITLNLKSEEGKEIFREMVKHVDIVVENFRPGTMEKLGLGYEDLKKINPALIYGACSGFGHTGPYSKRPGYDIVGQAMSGLMSVTGWPDTPPTRAGGPMSDTMGGLSLTIGILGALHYQRMTGIGQKVDIALVDSLLASLQIISQIYLIGGRQPERIGNRYESTYPYDTFPTKDGENIVIGCANDKFWGVLCRLMGREELITDERYDKNVKRVAAHEEVRPIVEEWTKTIDAEELLAILEDAGVPSAPVYNFEQIAKDPQIAGAREMFVEAEYPNAGKIKITNSHIKLSETKTGFRKPSPLLGEDNVSVYEELLGYDEAKVAELRNKGII